MTRDARPLASPPTRVRQRRRADGSWRIWWEPEAALLAAGFEVVDLDAARLTWSVREAERLNARATDWREAKGREAVAEVRRRTIDDLIAAYVRSPDFGRLAPRTQADYRAGFRRIAKTWGVSPLAFFTRGVMVQWHETVWRRSPSMAAASLRHMSVLMAYAERREWIGVNPCLRAGGGATPPRQRVPEWAEVDALVAAAEARGAASMALALRVAFLTGQRQTDILAARCEDFRDAPVVRGAAPVLTWIFTRSKRGNAAGVAIHPELEPALRARLAAGGRPELLVAEGTGLPYRDDWFRHLFALVRTDAAKALPSVADLQFRDLRRGFHHHARMGGAAARDVADATGNQSATNVRLSQTYMPPNAEAAARAVAALVRPMPDDQQQKDGTNG